VSFIDPLELDFLLYRWLRAENLRPQPAIEQEVEL
jgi:hypothetical protein